MNQTNLGLELEGDILVQSRTLVDKSYFFPYLFSFFFLYKFTCACFGNGVRSEGTKKTEISHQLIAVLTFFTISVPSFEIFFLLRVIT